METETLISDARARVIASEWHGGQGAPLYALSSSGAIVRGVFGEIRDAKRYTEREGQTRETERLAALERYLSDRMARGARGPVAGWSDLWDEGRDLTCPECGEPVWDRAHGHHLNKCWGCGVAFDGPWEDDDDE